MDSISIGAPGAAPLPGHERPEFPTLLHMLADAAINAPDRDALICDDEVLTFQEYARCIAGLKKELEVLGATGQRVAITMSNSNEAIIANWGIWATGAQSSYLNPFYAKDELLPQLTDVEPHILICHAPYVDDILPVAREAGISKFLIFGGENGLSLDQWRDDESLNITEPFPAPEDPAILIYTGGTTGVVKAAEHTHGEIVIAVRSVCEATPTRLDQEIWINAAPVFHIWAMLTGYWVPLLYRGTALTIRRFVPEDMIRVMEHRKATILSGGPAAFYNGLLNAPNIAEADLSNLTLCFGGGSPFLQDTLDRWDEIVRVPILECYGMSECAPIASNRNGTDRKPGSVGPCAPGTEAQIVDLETGTNILPIGESGEIRIRGPQAMKRYRNRPEETKETIRDGWIYTGDIGRIDEDGFVFLLDRKKEMVIVGGYNVYPREVEEKLLSHPATQEVAAIGVPDDYKGEVIWAYAVLKKDAAASEQDILQFCSDNLVAYKRPVGVTILEELPKTPANKTDKKALLAHYMSNS